MVFDVNDFDETLPGPWEWDIKRLAASLAIAARHRGVADVTACTTSCRRQCAHTGRPCASFAGMAHLSVWYSRLTRRRCSGGGQSPRSRSPGTAGHCGQGRSKDHLRAVAKLTVRSRRPAAIRVGTPAARARGRPVEGGGVEGDLMPALDELLERYAESLRPELRSLLGAYHVVDMARKVVGVGSVGTGAWIILLEGRDGADPLILQAKEAQASVLEAHVSPSEFSNHGERVVVGQRLMQSASDIFLGWVTVVGFDGRERDFYVRQLWDWKGSIDLDTILPYGLHVYGELCAWTLAGPMPARGIAIAIGAYLGAGDQFDRALVARRKVRRPKRLGPCPSRPRRTPGARRCRIWGLSAKGGNRPRIPETGRATSVLLGDG